MSAESGSLADKQTIAQTDQAKVLPEQARPQFTLQVSTDNMTAYLRIKPASPDQKVSYEEVCDFLQQEGITYGICENSIHTFCQEEKFYSELICAKGVAPIDGTDGLLHYNFDTDNSLRPKEREDGTVDFRNLGLVKNIAKGEVLCSITPPGPGKEGIDIYNHVVPFKQGRLPALPSGTNTVVSDDKLSLLAAVDGCIEFLKSRINVNDIFIVRGDVDGTSGNIKSNGSVVVQGDVREGFSVISGQDISVRGMVEGSVLEAKGTISLSNGMNGMGKGSLKAGGNIVGKYFENVTLNSNNDIYADILMNCRATAGGSIILKGKKASLIGGSYQAGRRIFVKNIGTTGNAITHVLIQSETIASLLVAGGGEENNLDKLNLKLSAAQKALEEFQEQFQTLTQQISANGQQSPERGKLLLKASIMKKSQLSEAVEQIKKQIKDLEEKTASLVDFNIVGLGIIYPGTKMSIGPHTTNIQNEYSNTKFYADPERIVFGPVLPSDAV